MRKHVQNVIEETIVYAKDLSLYELSEFIDVGKRAVEKEDLKEAREAMLEAIERLEAIYEQRCREEVS
jgi:predicted DNA-binding protein YlxM (UPF0122 family)